MRTPAILSVSALLFLTTAAHAVDHDRDGLADDFEQELLQRFVPTFMVAVGDCDVLPSEFRPSSQEPACGREKRHDLWTGVPEGEFIEIHYYHLWSRDCGRRGHALDVEYVSALIRAGKAAYWYASAHQDTVCDVRNGARASQLQAEEHGPLVWISRGKHAFILELRSLQSRVRRGSLRSGGAVYSG
jgi:hypothetical protein